MAVFLGEYIIPRLQLPLTKHPLQHPTRTQNLLIRLLGSPQIGQPPLGSLHLPVLTIPIPLKPNTLGLRNHPLDHFPDIHALLELLTHLCDLLGKCRCYHGHRETHILFAADRPDLKFVAGEGEGAGAVAIGIIL
jgi:hypothetical protein